MKIAGRLLLMLLSLLVVFHVLVLLDVLPYDQTWGGSIQDKSQVIAYEGFAIVLTLVFILMVSIKLDYLKIKRLQKVADIAIWIMVGFFAISLIGNIMAKGAMERTIFTPLSIVLVLLSFRLAVSKRK
ncbi:MAG: hypothetical protein VX798_11815 [Bacteroidota bacterium]|nr:hypothetical protein [Bacteroidota bacterium]